MNLATCPIYYTPSPNPDIGAIHKPFYFLFCDGELQGGLNHKFLTYI